MKNIAKKSEKVKVSKKEIAKVEIQQKLAHVGGGFNDLGVALRNGAFFDTQRKRQRKPRRYDIKMFDENFGIVIKRDENTILHQRVFEATLELGKSRDDGKLIIENMYQLKKFSGINTDTSDNEIIKMLTEILNTTVELYKKNETTQKYELYSAFHLIGNIIPVHVDNDDTTTKANSPKILEIKLDEEFKKAVNSLIKVKIDRNLLKYIHQNIKSAYADRLVKFFLTQQRNLTYKGAGFWSLIKMISDFPAIDKNQQNSKIDNLSDRHKRRILAEIEKESDKMKEFGIEFIRKEHKIFFNFANNTHKNKVIMAYPSSLPNPNPTTPAHKSGGFFYKAIFLF